jgi:hypothetical protein
MNHSTQQCGVCSKPFGRIAKRSKRHSEVCEVCSSEMRQGELLATELSKVIIEWSESRGLDGSGLGYVMTEVLELTKDFGGLQALGNKSWAGVAV